jgi:ATP synthase protein I
VPEPEPKLSSGAERMIRQVGAEQDRMIRARRRTNGNWSSIAILGVIGWSVAIPTLAGIAVGLWIDHHWPSRFSWTLMLMIGGLVFGCVSAWLHVKGDQS